MWLKDMKTSEQWCRENPKKSTRLWMNEKAAAVCLLGAEERSGKDEYLSLQPIWEGTPREWVRRKHVRDMLERIE